MSRSVIGIACILCLSALLSGCATPRPVLDLAKRGVGAATMAEVELDRYLGWPGQAPSYQIGERLWLSARDQVREREGDGFSLSQFHRRALDLGSVGLDVLQESLLAGGH